MAASEVHSVDNALGSTVCEGLLQGGPFWGGRQVVGTLEAAY